MKKIYLALAAVSLLVAYCPKAFAQQGEGGYNESVVVRGSFNPTLEPSEKLSFPAVITDTLGRMEHSFQYGITPSRLRAIYEPARIKAARIIGEPSTKLYNNYLRIGFGNYWTPLADLYWSSTRDRVKTYGIRVNHLSSWGTLSKVGSEELHSAAARNYGPNHMNRTGVTLFGKYIIGEKLQLSTDLGYEHDHNLYYGFNDSTLDARLGMTRDSFSTADYRASYNVATWNLGIRNMQLDPNKLGYSANLHLSDLWATYGQNQFNIGLSGDINYGFEIANQYRGVAYLHASWDGYTDAVSPDIEATCPLGCTLPAVWDTVRGYRNIVKVNPYADFMFSGLQFHAGLTTAWDAFSKPDSTKFYIFPDVIVSKKLMRDNLVLSLGITGGLEANDWNSIRLINPYVVQGSEQRATRHYDFGAHARWTISRKLEANFDIAYQLFRDDMTFTVDTNYCLMNVYKPLYVNDNRFAVGGVITFVNDEMLTLRAGGHYYSYTPVGDDTVLLYRPQWDALLAATVNYHDKWFFHLESQLLGKMQGDFEQQLPVRYGIAAEVEYRHNRALSFFVKFDNIAFQRYWLWTNYPSQRGLFLAGLTYTIPNK